MTPRGHRPAQGDIGRPEGINSSHRISHLLLVAQVKVGIVGKLQGQHVCRVLLENLLPQLTGFWEVPGSQERCLSSPEISSPMASGRGFPPASVTAHTELLKIHRHASASACGSENAKATGSFYFLIQAKKKTGFTSCQFT